MKTIHLFVFAMAAIWLTEAQEFGSVIRVLKSGNRVNIGGRSYRVKQTKNLQSLTSRNGSCVHDNQIFRHGTSVKRSDACDKCMCLSGELLCWKVQCPQMKISKGCREVRREGICCPIIECQPDVPLKNNKHTFNEKKQRPFTPIPIKQQYFVGDCEIDGQKYYYGQRIDRASGACLECRCGTEGQMKCKAKKCPNTGTLDLRKLAKVSQNTQTPAKSPIMIEQTPH